MPGKRSSGGVRERATDSPRDRRETTIDRVQRLAAHKKHGLLGRIVDRLQGASAAVDGAIAGTADKAYKRSPTIVQLAGKYSGAEEIVRGLHTGLQHPIKRLTEGGQMEVPWGPAGPSRLAKDALEHSWLRSLPAGRAQTGWRRNAEAEAEKLLRGEGASDKVHTGFSSWRLEEMVLRPEYKAMQQSTAKRLLRGIRPKSGKGRVPWEMTPDEFLADPNVVAHWTLAGPKTPHNSSGHHGGTMESAIDRAVHRIPMGAERSSNKVGAIHGFTVDGIRAPINRVMTDSAANDMTALTFGEKRGTGMYGYARGVHSALRDRPRKSMRPDQTAEGWTEGQIRELTPETIDQYVSRLPYSTRIEGSHYTSAKYLNNVEDPGSISVVGGDPRGVRTHREWLLDASNAGAKIPDRVLKAAGITESELRRLARRRSLLLRGKLVTGNNGLFDQAEDYLFGLGEQMPSGTMNDRAAAMPRHLRAQMTSTSRNPRFKRGG